MRTQKPGFQSAVQSLQQLGVRVAPYINGRIFDTGTATWTKDKAAAFAAKFVTPAVDDPKLQLYTESYGSGATFAVRPCFPWQRLVWIALVC